jgi:glutamate/tyrosine decarboxylase-like PLP-dependent enzyme
MKSPTIRAARVGAAAAERYLSNLEERQVAPTDIAIAALKGFEEALPLQPSDPEFVVEMLDRLGSPATMASAGPRFFGLVVGGALPATVGARLLTTAWDQIVFSAAISPVGCKLERVAAGWLLDLLRLPTASHVSYVTGATMGNFTCLAAAREFLLTRKGHAPSEMGLWSAPRLRIVATQELHVTVVKALGLLGWGRADIERVPTDRQGRLDPRQLPELDDSCIVIAQAGNVNSGAVDPLGAICERANRAGAWVHVDGAFGLWASASSRRRHMTEGVDQASSWVVDAHKLLNTPYDCAMAIIRQPEPLHAVMATQAAYLKPGVEVAPKDMGPEFSRSARGVEVWAALRSLGRQGLEDMIERCCGHAEAIASGLEQLGFRVLNDVVFNQVVASIGTAAEHERIAAAVQASGDAWFGVTNWQGQSAIRISIANWSTTGADVQRTIEAIRVALHHRKD